jgi:hypothetical protein
MLVNMLKIINDAFVNAINEIVRKVFINLEIAERTYVERIMQNLLDYMCMKFGFDESNVSQFYALMKQNNFQHIYSSIKLLFPYIDDTNSFALFAEIYQLKDITTKKKSQQDFTVDRTKDPYLLNTFQYSRSFLKNVSNTRENLNAIDARQTTLTEYDSFVEYAFGYEDINMLFLFLLETIELSRSKMYVNWLNILPITRQSFRESKLYKNSFDIVDGKMMITDNLVGNMPLQNVRTVESTSELPDAIYYRGISVHDIYNAFNVFLFNDIFNSGVKWLIYEQQMELNERPMTYLEILHDTFDINSLATPFEELGSVKTQIISKWKSIETSNKDIYARFIRCLMLKFDLTFCDEDIKEEFNYDYETFYKEFKSRELDDEDGFDKKDKNGQPTLERISITSSSFIEKKNDFFAKIPAHVIHKFVYAQIEKFKKTWYGKQMIIEDENGQQTVQTNVSETFSLGNTEFKAGDNTFFVTYKNIYNYAKSIIINTLDDGKKTKDKTKAITQFTSRNLSDEMWIKFFSMLNGETRGWFRINRVIQQTYGQVDERALKGYQNHIDTKIRENTKDIVFLVLIGAGLLTEIVPNPELTDKKLLGRTDDEITATVIKRVKKKYVGTSLGTEMLNTEYYLTRRRYKSLELYKDTKRITWFEHLTNGQPWYNFFAFSIISQLTFNLHFLNNRVMMVTGATGQGKSVAVPILLYHATIALTMNLRAKVLSTQALVAATLKNSKFMAGNLGVPIDINGYKTFEKYLQYSTQDDKHLTVGSETFIKEVTDRTLLEELLKNPLLKKTVGNNKYLDENLYDVIIIDEAHMHNTSMDMILTIIKNSILINNQVKLVITSATMEADEYIYRRYYRFIDDNFMFPIVPNKMAAGNSIQLVYDRNFIDRRYHISPPGETSRYIVTDTYLANDTNSYEEAEAEGISLVKKIIGSSSGDFLFFTTTEANIKKIVTELNEHIPAHVIALPLYSGMRNSAGDINWFSVIEDIAKTKPDIEYSKEDILDVITNGEQGFEKILKGRYTQAIVVATNVVEASVTIDSLRYVIDTGYSLAVNYNFMTNKNVIDPTNKISDASRMQRRGRIGRTSSGTAYYMYAKGARAHIRPSYDLVGKDITFDVLNIMADNAQTLLYDIEKHPQSYDFKELGSEGYNEFCSQESNKTIRRIYEQQYRCSFTHISDTIFPFGDINTMVVPDNFKLSFAPLYETGYGITSLLDYNGSFYIVHPGEPFLERDIMTGQPFRHNLTNPEIYPISYVGKTLSIMNKLLMIKHIYYDSDMQINIRPDTASEYDPHVFKYSYVILINKLITDNADIFAGLGKNFSPDVIVKIVKTICVGNMLGCQNNITKIISLMYSIGKYTTFVSPNERNPKIRKFTEFKERWKDNGSELESYLSIMNHFDEYNKSSEKIVNNFEGDRILDRYKTYNDMVLKHGIKMFVDPTIIDKSDLSKSEIRSFTESRNQRLKSDKIKEKFKDLAKNHLIETSDINSKCDKAFVTVKPILNALALYSKLQLMMTKPKIINFMSVFRDIYLINFTGYDCITMSFLENYVENICKYSSTKKTFKTLFDKLTIPAPNIVLTNLYDSTFFYCHAEEKALFGIVPVTHDMIRTVTSAMPNESHLVDPTKITNKSKISDPKNKVYDMNESIGAELKIYEN